MKRWFVVAALGSLMLVPSLGAVAQRSPEAEARQAAQSWLALVDAGRYGESWEASSPQFKAKVTKARWESMLSRSRAPLGREESRVFRLAHAADNPPNSPPGEYEFLQYLTNYRKQRSAVETVALIKGKDGRFRVIEYSLQR